MRVCCAGCWRSARAPAIHPVDAEDSREAWIGAAEARDGALLLLQALREAALRSHDRELELPRFHRSSERNRRLSMCMYHAATQHGASDAACEYALAAAPSTY